MKPHRNIFMLLLIALVNVFYKAVAFVYEHYIPKRDFRLNGLINKVASSVNNAFVTVNDWKYAMFARWHVDSCSIA